MIYIFILIMLLFFAVVERKGMFAGRKELDLVGYYFAGFLLIAVAGFRYRVGGDTLSYMSAFESSPFFSQLASFDFNAAEYNPGWYVFIAAIKSTVNSFYFFQIIHALILNAAILLFFKKFTAENKFSCLLLYYCSYYLYFNMEVLRESLCIAIFLLSIDYLLNKKWIKYLVVCALCVSIHYSAIILLFFPFMFIRMRKIYVYLILAVVIILSTYNVYELLQFISLTNMIEAKMNSYLNADLNINGMLRQMLIILPTLIIWRLRVNAQLSTHRFQNSVLAFLALGFLSVIVPGIYRFLNYLFVINIVYIVDTIIDLHRIHMLRIKYTVVCNLVIVMLVINYSYALFRDTSNFEPDTRFYQLYYPYHSILKPKIEAKREKIYFNQMNSNL